MHIPTQTPGASWPPVPAVVAHRGGLKIVYDTESNYKLENEATI